MKEDQKDSNKKTTSNPKEQQNKELFTKHPAPKKYRNKSVNKYKVNINPNIKRNLINYNNDLNLLGNMGIDKKVQDIIFDQNPNPNLNNNNIKPEINSYKNVNQVINHNVQRHFFG